MSLPHADTWQAVAASLNIKTIKKKSVFQRRGLGLHAIRDSFNDSLIPMCLILRHLKRPHQVRLLEIQISFTDSLKYKYKVFKILSSLWIFTF